jgi:hypothetical protein
VFLPPDMPEGTYDLDLALVCPASNQPKVKLAISNMKDDGWYSMGKISVKK